MIHCDDYIDDETQPDCLRTFLRFRRAPAIEQNGEPPALFATLKEAATGRTYLGHWIGNEPAIKDIPLAAGQRIRVVMASRFGDVGITPSLEAKNGYVLRVPLSALCEFSETQGIIEK